MNETEKDGNRGKAIYALIKKEFMDNIRNKWVIVLSILFVALILLISTYGGTTTREEVGIQGFKFTITMGRQLVVLLISIVAVILGKGAITNEVESKSIGLLLTTEIGRKDVVIGKFIGLGSVLATAIGIGLGTGGIIIGLSAGFEGVGLYGKFMLFSFLFAINYLSIALCMSAFVKQSSRALALGIFIWIFFNILWSLVLFAILIATGWELPTGPQVPGTPIFPDWYFFARLANPNMIFNTEITRLLSRGTTLPDLLDLPLLIGATLAWIFIPLLIAILGFNLKDL